jgi:hypothetical protein
VTLPWDLEDWLTAEGDRVVTKQASGQALTPDEELVFHVWLFDTEQRNGGVSQYFCNSADEWPVLCACAAQRLPALCAFAAKVAAVLRESDDPYEAVLSSTTDLDSEYEACHVAVVTELRRAIAQ